MILDEATSALDPGLERAVLDAISRLDCTTLMVTHRESVVVTAERIIVLDSGRIVEDGTPNQVIGAGGPYDQLWVLRPDQQRQMIDQAIDTQLLDDTESARDASGAAGR